MINKQNPNATSMSVQGKTTCVNTNKADRSVFSFGECTRPAKLVHGISKERLNSNLFNKHKFCAFCWYFPEREMSMHVHLSIRWGGKGRGRVECFGDPVFHCVSLATDKNTTNSDRITDFRKFWVYQLSHSKKPQPYVPSVGASDRLKTHERRSSPFRALCFLSLLYSSIQIIWTIPLFYYFGFGFISFDVLAKFNSQVEAKQRRKNTNTRNNNGMNNGG